MVAVSCRRRKQNAGHEFPLDIDFWRHRSTAKSVGNVTKGGRLEKNDRVPAAGISGSKSSVVYMLLVVVVAGGVDEHVAVPFWFWTLIFELPPRPACIPPIAPPTIAPIKIRIKRTTITSPFFVLQKG